MCTHGTLAHIFVFERLFGAFVLRSSAGPQQSLLAPTCPRFRLIATMQLWWSRKLARVLSAPRPFPQGGARFQAACR